MPRLIKLFLIAGLFCLPMLAAAQKESGDAAQIISLEKKWADAYKHRDISVLSSLLAPDFFITVEDGSTYGKEGYIGHTADSSVHVDLSEFSELKVRFHGTTAIVTGAYSEKGSEKGKTYEYHDRFTDVWVKTPSSWQVISSHYSVPVK